MRSIIIFGAVVALLGLLGLAMPVFTTQQTKDVAKLGDLKLQTKENTEHAIPPLVREGAIVIGVVLICAGVFASRSSTPNV